MFNRFNQLNMIDRSATFPYAVVWIASGLLLFALVDGSLRSSPTFDETAHFASGVILAQNEDAGYFKVNPPVNKWITACSSLLAPRMTMPPLALSSSFPNSERHEFEAGDALLELNKDGSYFPALVIARLARAPFIFLASWMLWQLTIQWPTSKRLICQILWCTSPLILGHGWIVSADALCGVAMCFILWTTAMLWKNPTWIGFALSGLAWGLAIGTKFTFGPLYLAYPIAVHLCASKGWTTAMATRANPHPIEVPISVFRRVLFVSRYWIFQATVACLVVNALYLFHETAMPIGKHDFIGMTFRSLTKPDEADLAIVKYGKSLVAMIPSPFPRSFLEGVDQQMADMDRPRGAYFLGSRFPGEIHWFYLVGYAMKEQLAVLMAAMVGVAGFLGRRVQCTLLRSTVSRTVEDNRSTSRLDDSLLMFCTFYLLVFILFMTSQSNLVWNVRYLIPGLPMIYLLVSAAMPTFEIRFTSMRHAPLRRDLPTVPNECRTVDLLFVTLLSLASIEFFLHFPHHFSYINPLFGGSNRVPIALNDSNFDYGQDLFYARDWVDRLQAKSSNPNSTKVYGALSGHGSYWLEGIVEPANVEILQKAVNARKESKTNLHDVNASGDRKVDVIILSRGLFHPEPWAIGNSKLGEDPLDPDELLLVQELLSHPPDVWVTPVVVVYWIVHD